MRYSQPCQWTLLLNNSAGDYPKTAALANPRTASSYCNLTVDNGVNDWVSPDLKIKSYELVGKLVTLSGQCRLSELNKNDQWVDVGDGTCTLEGVTLSVALGLIGTAFGFTFSGVPSRNVVGPYHLDGNPLQWIRDLLGPTHVFRMGDGNEIVIEASTGQISTATYTDRVELEEVRFRRTDEGYNNATVERLEQASGRVVLYDESHSGGDVVDLQGPFDLSQPSRNLFFEIMNGYRGEITGISLKDSEGDPVGTQPLPGRNYVGNDPVSAFTFNYDVSEDANSWGVPWVPNWHIRIVGYPVSASPPATEGYSKSGTAGLGDNPYPQPFSTLNLETGTEAQAAADALATRGHRSSTIVNKRMRLRVDFPLPNKAFTIVDADTGLSDLAVAENVMVQWNEASNTGSIEIGASINEAS